MSGDGGQPITVLHVDDEPDFADIVATYLERSHDAISVHTATSAEEGLDRLAETAVDCVVSDHDMPGMDGLEFLRAVRERRPDLPFILFTGKGNEEIASDAISAGVTEYLQKGSGTDQYAVLANRIERAVEEHRAKAALEESERMLSTLISNLPGMAYRCRNDPGWPMEFVSDGCADLTGYTAHEIESSEVVWGEDILLPEEQDRLWEEVQAALDEREPFEVTYRIRTADSETKWVWEQGRGVFEDGELIALEGIILDISDREADKEALRAAERRHEALVETIPTPLVAADATNEIIEVNDAATTLFERSRTDLLGTDVSSLFAPESMERARSVLSFEDSGPGEVVVPVRAGERMCQATVRKNVVETAQGPVLQLVFDRVTPFEDVVDRIDDAFAALDSELCITYCNDRAASLLSADGDPVGRNICAVLPDGVEPSFEDRVTTAIETGEPVEFEAYHPPVEQFFDVVCYPDEDGVSVWAREVTDQRERAADLERYRTLVENVGDPMYVLDTDATIRMANRAMADYLGYDRDEIVGSHASRFMPESDVETGSRILTELVDSEETWGTFEMETIHADGSRSLNEDKVAALTGQDGEFVGSVGVIRDISERKQRERDLRRYETIIQAVGDPVYALDPEGYVTFVNDAAKALTGYDPEDIVGEHVTTVVSEADYETSQEEVTRLLSSPDLTYATFEIDIIAKDGTRIPAENHLALLGNSEDFRGMAGVIRDISERKRRERRLEEFASVVSHDLQSPLNVIDGRAELALETGELSHVEPIRDATDRMETLIQDLLTLAQEGKTVGGTEQTALDAVAREAWAGVQTPAATLEVDTEATVQADPARLRELLSNLVRNAVDHAGPNVTVRVGSEDDCFYVADDGPGIDPDKRDRVFAHGHTTSEEGTGLGLTIVENIAEAHGWAVEVTESAAGGARFEVLTD